jgi:transposase-like protein
VIPLAVRWYLRFRLFCQVLVEFLAERCMEADHVTLYPRVQGLTPLLIDAARPFQHELAVARSSTRPM